MSLPRSWIGAVVTLLYLGLAVFIAQDEIRNSHGGWINPRGFGTVLVTAHRRRLALSWPQDHTRR